MQRFYFTFFVNVLFTCQQNKEASEAADQTELGKIGIIVTELLLEPCLHTFCCNSMQFVSYSHCCHCKFVAETHLIVINSIIAVEVSVSLFIKL